jgi:hypothetical protein
VGICFGTAGIAISSSPLMREAGLMAEKHTGGCPVKRQNPAPAILMALTGTGWSHHTRRRKFGLTLEPI